MAHTSVNRYLVVSHGLLFPGWNPIVALLRLILALHVMDSIRDGARGSREQRRLDHCASAQADGRAEYRTDIASRRAPDPAAPG